MDGIETFRELKPNKLIQKLLSYIGEGLPLFPKSEEFRDVLIKKKNENQHSQALTLYLTNRCQSAFNFSRENAQKGSSTIDIAVYKRSVLIFTIESKLLPTPKQKGRLEHEYVYGKGAGIQRFKDGQHGVDNEDNQFSDSGILAFIKANNFDFWLGKVNQWILDANWQVSEQLQKVEFGEVATLRSAHARQDGSMIRLHHFWVSVS